MASLKAGLPAPNLCPEPCSWSPEALPDSGENLHQNWGGSWISRWAQVALVVGEAG